jgi:uncharacterized protein
MSNSSSTSGPRSYLSPKVEARPNRDKGGWGVYASQPVAKDEVLVVWGGDVVDGETFQGLSAEAQHHGVQVEEDLYQVSREPLEPADFINHACEPTVGMSGQIVLVALRALAPGDEICLDYAMCDGTPYDEFDCACGAQNCRGRVTGNDWARPDLQQRYAGYFSPYLQRRIDRARNS